MWKIKIGLIFANSTLEETIWKKSSFTVKKHSSEKLVNDKNQNWRCTIYTWPLSSQVTQEKNKKKKLIYIQKPSFSKK